MFHVVFPEAGYVQSLAGGKDYTRLLASDNAKAEELDLRTCGQADASKDDQEEKVSGVHKRLLSFHSNERYRRIDDFPTESPDPRCRYQSSTEMDQGTIVSPGSDFPFA